MFTIVFGTIEPVIKMTKYRILKMLIQSDDYISGEIISNELGITRAAVNAAVKSLREEGYVIDSATNRGYLLVSSPDLLNEGEISSHLSDDQMKNVCFLPEVGSTNDHLRAMAYEGAPQGQVVISDCQTKGKGRQGRSFSSPSGAGVYFSYLFRPQTLPADTAEITAWAAVTVHEAIRSVCDFESEIKWINDLVVGEKKLCGILTELAVEAESGRVEFVIIGVGINCNETTDEFDLEIRERATSLFLQTGSKVNRGHLAAELVKHFDRMDGDWPAKHDWYLERYRRWCNTTGRSVRILRGQEAEVVYAEGIDDGFGLVVRRNDGTVKVLNSGEVSTRPV